MSESLFLKKSDFRPALELPIRRNLSDVLNKLPNPFKEQIEPEPRRITINPKQYSRILIRRAEKAQSRQNPAKIRKVLQTNKSRIFTSLDTSMQ